jgi:hypothetical protein
LTSTILWRRVINKMARVVKSLGCNHSYLR